MKQMSAFQSEAYHLSMHMQKVCNKHAEWPEFDTSMSFKFAIATEVQTTKTAAEQYMRDLHLNSSDLQGQTHLWTMMICSLHKA